MFSILGGDLSGAVFWDLFCGTGAMGLEALSCDAALSVFVDSSQAALEGVGRFLAARDARDRGRLERKTLPFDLASLPGPAEAVFLDPPYRLSGIYSWIESVRWSDLVSPGAIVMAESGSSDSLPGWEKRRYGSSWLFIRRG